MVYYQFLFLWACSFYHIRKFANSINSYENVNMQSHKTPTNAEEIFFNEKLSMPYGIAKAIYPPLKLFACSPFTDTTTYCLLPTAYVEGIELAIPGSWYSHKTFPV